jgi:alpha-ketoglutaric semialdehyde dehydrogenase
MEILGTSIIGFSSALQSDTSIKAVDPSTGLEIEPPFYNAESETVEQAATLASQAFLIYSKKSSHERASFLNEIATQIESIGAALVTRAMQETGLPEGRIKGETGRTTGQLRLFASLIEDGSWTQARIETALPDRSPLPRPDIRSMSRPLGPVVVFAASNFPLAFSTAGGDTASALASGCPVIVKAHSSHPGTAELIARAVQKAAKITGMPDGVFSLLFGGGRTVGSALVAHPAIKAVGFTGSTAGGTALMEVAAKLPEPIPVYAEMGSVNPIVLLPEAVAHNGDAIAAGLHISATMGVGQFCTNPGVVCIKKDASGDALVDHFVEKMKDTAAQVMLNPTIHRAYKDALSKMQANKSVTTMTPPA